MLANQNIYIKLLLFVVLFFAHHLTASSCASNWANVTPASSPGARYAAAMAFDPCNGRLILFGGYNGTYLGDTWVYDAKANTWTDVAPASSPPARDFATMAFDPCSGQMILFGGNNNISGLLGDTWVYDATANTWTQVSTNSPGAREAAVMAFDPCSGQLILFGGFGNSGLLGDTWAYNTTASTPTWTQVTTNSPGARSSAVMAFDSCSGQLILFGGVGNTGLLGDTWAYDATAPTPTWTQVTTNSPGARENAVMAFDPCSGQLILFGGNNNGGPLVDTWAYNATVTTTNKWTPVTTNSPGARTNAVMAFDPCNGKLILFGGDNGTYLDDTLIYDATTNTWTDVTPTSSPPARAFATMAFDPCSGQLILFGGSNNISGLLSDTWAYDAKANTWTNVTPTSSPPARAFATMAFDPCSGQVILFGGLGSSGLLGDTWAYDATATNPWMQVTTNSPGSRTSATMAFDPCSGQLILFGGLDNSGLLDDTWAYDATATTTNKWTQVVTNSPGARADAVMAFDPCNGQIILFGGSGSFVGDTWAYDATATITNKWMPVTTNSPGTRANAVMAFDPCSGQMILFGGYNSITGNFLGDTWALGMGFAPQITSNNTAIFTVGIFSNFTVTTTGCPTPSITETGTLPSGITFVDNGNGTATLSGTPAAGTGGIYPLSFTAMNGVAPNAVQQFTLIVHQPPAITSADSTVFQVDVPASFMVTTTGFPTPSITETGALPSGITFVDNGNGTATLFGTPAEGTEGIYSLIFTAMNGVLPNAVQNFTLIVNPSPIPPPLLPTTTTLQVSPNPAGLNQPVTLSASVTPSAATGTVTFFDGQTVLGTTSLNQEGVATLTITFLAAGEHQLYAIYNGNEIYLSSTSSVVTLVVEESPLPPRKARGCQKISLYSLHATNILTWKAPYGGTPIVVYRIYQDRSLTELIAEVPNNKCLIFKDRHRKRGKTYIYYIVSVDQFGNLSQPAIVKVRGRKS